MLEGVCLISNQIIQNSIEGLKNITQVDLSVIERDGSVAASTIEGAVGETENDIAAFIAGPAEIQSIAGAQYFKVYESGICEYIVKVQGEQDEHYRIGKIAAFQIQNLLVAYKERYDKDNFIKNLLLDNFLLIDIYNRAKKFHLEINERRVVFLIGVSLESKVSPADVLRGIFPSKSKDFVTSLDENSVILVKEIKQKDTTDDINKLAMFIYDSMKAEACDVTYVAVGTVVNDLKDVSHSYKEAKMALEVGKIFEPDNNIMNYDNLGIGRLIFQLPIPLCKLFIKEVLHGLTIDDFDEETLATLSKFFENNLNVSETARQLYIHRNTLVYRLDKLQKMTGLDLRNFEDSVTFKITLMVSKFMIYFEGASY
jgi:carbohydrate diacid regulator